MSSNNDKKSTGGGRSTAAAAAEEKKTTTIQEGSAKMRFPATEASTVFYNPVQVQNRDLSILMITLYSERRRAAKLAERAKKKVQQQKAAAAAANTESNATKEEEEEPAVAAAAPNGTDDTNKSNDDDDVQGMTILEALAASGLRSIRYWNEIPNVRHITINDFDATAVERAHTNMELNNLQDQVIDCSSTEDDSGIDPATHQRKPGICIHRGDATHELYMSRRPQKTKITPANAAIEARKQPCWDVIDLDPYGSAAFLLDATIQAVENGGFLCITCTDMAALGGSHPETAYGRYASMPVQRAGYLHEFALRSLLYSIATAAARYGRTIRPILSVGMDFYVRVFVEVYNDKAGVNALSLQMGTVFQSTQCPAFHIVKTGQLGGKKKNVYQNGRTPSAANQCEETGASYKLAGPIWLGPLHDKQVVAQALERLERTDSNNDGLYPKLKWIATKDRLRGLLTSCYEELDDAPLYYRIPDLAQSVKSASTPLIEFKAALVNAGYQVSGFHKEAQAIKTNAPSRVVFDIVRAWCKKNPPKKTPPAGSAAEKILSQPIAESTTIDWSIPASLRSQNKANKRAKAPARFPNNPEANWGPKPKASGQKRKAEQSPEETADNEAE